MATYILFWNPGISSYTKERFLKDFEEYECVSNWSFYEHEKVKDGDSFFMVKCGEGRTGIVMRGAITSECYHGRDWSPKNRKDIYYANIEAGACINPWSDAPLLTPEMLTEAIPDFDWYGGHSGRRLSVADANKLDKLWVEYLDRSQAAFCGDDAWGDEYYECIISKAEARKLVRRHGCCCEVCGYSYAKVFSTEEAAARDRDAYPRIVNHPSLNRLLFNICLNCRRMPDEEIARILLEKQGDG